MTEETKTAASDESIEYISIYDETDQAEAQCGSDRRSVIKNIETALAEGDLFRKVEIGDPNVDDEQVKRVLLPFDIQRKRLTSRLRGWIARKIAARETRRLNKYTEIVGLSNALGVEGGAIVTANHFSYMDNTVIRLLAMACGREKRFDIVIQQNNVFMKGYFGFLMRNCQTMPLCDHPSYMAKTFKPAMDKFLADGHFVLIYPEQEMWFNYRKPRDLREGAYYYAVASDVPVIPCFTELRTATERGEGGLLRVDHILHVMPPIYPDKSLPVRERRAALMEADRAAKRACYERVYGRKLDYSFDAERDIAGLVPDAVAVR